MQVPSLISVSALAAEWIEITGSLDALAEKIVSALAAEWIEIYRINLRL